MQQFRNVLASYPAPKTVPDMRARALMGSVGANGRNAARHAPLARLALYGPGGILAGTGGALVVLPRRGIE